MDLKDTAKQIRQILLLLQESGFTMAIILTSIDRYARSCSRSKRLCTARRIIGIVRFAERMKSESL